MEGGITLGWFTLVFLHWLMAGRGWVASLRGGGVAKLALRLNHGLYQCFLALFSKGTETMNRCWMFVVPSPQSKLATFSCKRTEYFFSAEIICYFRIQLQTEETKMILAQLLLRESYYLLWALTKYCCKKEVQMGPG